MTETVTPVQTVREFKVWHIPQVPMDAFEVSVPSLDEARRLRDALANYDLFQYENNVKPDYANMGGVSYRDETTEGEWCDVEDDEDLDA